MADRKVSATRTISAIPERIFALLVDPSKHPSIDGSGTVLAARPGNAQRLRLGSTFGMDMKMGLPYRITNKVVEYEENRLIAWRHGGGHRWRWELKPSGDGATEVTETFDWGLAPAGFFYPLLGFPQRNLKGIQSSLARLETLVAEAD